jgi:hypothetical protein
MVFPMTAGNLRRGNLADGDTCTRMPQAFDVKATPATCTNMSWVCCADGLGPGVVQVVVDEGELAEIWHRGAMVGWWAGRGER